FTDQVSRGYRADTETNLANRYRPRTGAREAVLRGRALRIVRVERRRTELVAGARIVQSSASAAMAARRRGDVSAHDHSRSSKHATNACCSLHGRRLSHR